ncbi:MAG: MBL fold metallo-hydrolase [Acidobacteria bacterium]|nr:MBL fold metallo-hydrolase [Acidobacteriota bacterium]
MKLQRFDVPGLSHYSYLLESAGAAAVIDPKRDVDSYIETAAAHDVNIVAVFETHIHADYASGALELARTVGADLFVSGHDAGETFECRFPHRDVRDGDEVTIGQVRLRALYTPGHTPEHVSFLLYDTIRNPREPLAMFSGDFIFVGSLGRPDLLGEDAKRRLASELYDSAHTRIAALPDGLEIYPAHGAGSMCGAGMSDRPQSTLGYERRSSLLLAPQDKERFIDTVLTHVPPFPPYYRRMKRVNSEGPKMIGVPGNRALTPAEFRELREGVVIDVRRPEAFGGAHIPASYNIGSGPNLPVWASWIVPYDRPVLLVGDDSTNYDEARRALIRVGLDDVRGWLKAGMRAWIEAGFDQAHVRQMSVGELAAELENDPFVLDVRGDAEWASGHIAGARHIMGGELPDRLDEIPRDRTIHVTCGGGYRSSVAASVLRVAGYRDVVNVVGGMEAWKRSSLPIERVGEGVGV